MNELATSKYSLQVADTEQIGVSVGKLFATLHSRDSGKLMKAVMDNYLDVLSDVPGWAVEQASELYRTGKKGDGRFVPEAGELAKAARQLVGAESERERFQAKRKRELESLKAEIAERERLKAFRAGITPESKARVEAMKKKAQAQIATAKLANELHISSQPKSNLPDMKATHERFAPEGRKATLRTLEEKA